MQINGIIIIEMHDALLYALDKQTEQTNPTSTTFLWQKQAARKSILSCVGTDITLRIEGGERCDIFDLRSIRDARSELGKIYNER